MTATQIQSERCTIRHAPRAVATSSVSGFTEARLGCSEPLPTRANRSSLRSSTPVAGPTRSTAERQLPTASSKLPASAYASAVSRAGNHDSTPWTKCQDAAEVPADPRHTLARSFERRTPPQHVADPVEPRAAGPEHHEPEDHAEDAVVGLDEYCLFHRLANAEAERRRARFEQFLAAKQGFVAIVALEGRSVVIDFVLQVARSEGEQQDEDGERELQQAQQVRIEPVRHQQHGQDGQRDQATRRKHDRQSGLSRHGAIGPVEIRIEPPPLAQVQHVREAPLAASANSSASRLMPARPRVRTAPATAAAASRRPGPDPTCGQARCRCDRRRGRA